jgi:hypothetical protein
MDRTLRRPLSRRLRWAVRGVEVGACRPPPRRSSVGHPARLARAHARGARDRDRAGLGRARNAGVALATARRARPHVEELARGGVDAGEPENVLVGALRDAEPRHERHTLDRPHANELVAVGGHG